MLFGKSLAAPFSNVAKRNNFFEETIYQIQLNFDTNYFDTIIIFKQTQLIRTNTAKIEINTYFNQAQEFQPQLRETQILPITKVAFIFDTNVHSRFWSNSSKVMNITET